MKGKPSPDDVRALKIRHGLTGSQIAEICGTSASTVRGWLAPIKSKRYRPIPEAAWRLLRIAVGEMEPPKIEGKNA